MTTHVLWSPERYIRGVSLLLLIWLLVAVAVGASGQLAAADGLQRLLMPAMILLPVTVFALLWRGNARFRRRMLAIDSGRLVILHTWRMLGAGFLMLYAQDLLPGRFAWPAGIGDMLAALGALFIGSALLQGRPVARVLLLGWNTLGLLDLIIAVTIGVLLNSQNLGGAVNTDVMALLPLNLIPTVLVPLYVITHILIYLRLRGVKQVR